MAKKTGRGKSWCPSSVDLLLDLVGNILPLGKNGREKVEIQFNHLGEAQLLPPTGDPDCPPENQRAKRIQREVDETDAFDEATPPTQPAPLDEALGEVVGRTGMQASELQSLSDSLKHGRDAKNTSAGLLSYTAKKRRSIDKYIKGAAEAELKATSDIMTLFLLIDERATKHERSRLEGQEKHDRGRSRNQGSCAEPR
ncbi:Aste57867_7921 [Aphanomyces stellatus]|uniref:Aste57867_7921 protein n=1 Tax=Aphanomyces stellatus TaxID=120398 RepID=A0A485KIY8_9STRA|nr:hypothetical protein As57867_007891 [Aphanomyces stellatus]VFT84814.1 Aste57867_7921 [Aphanomyces stellatus]